MIQILLMVLKGQSWQTVLFHTINTLLCSSLHCLDLSFTGQDLMRPLIISSLVSSVILLNKLLLLGVHASVDAATV